MIQDITKYLVLLGLTGLLVCLFKGDLQMFYNSVGCVALFRIVILENKKVLDD